MNLQSTELERTERQMILVTGATGTVGREVVAQLLQAGQRVRALTRDPSKAQFDERVEVTRGDLSKPETLTKAVQGVESVFSLALGPGLGEQEANLARTAKTAGVRHIVKLSVLGAATEPRSRVALWHATGERAIQESRIPWTFVRPGAFMSNTLFWRDSIRSQGKVFSNYGDGKLPPVDPRDIAAVAVLALTTDGHEGKAYSITGPEALSVGEQVAILSDILGKQIEYVPITDETAREGMKKSGMPAYLIDALLPFAAYIRSGKAAEVLPTVEEITGKRPSTFAHWARVHAEAFA
jgi:uncharacterized protein YbjT (DUF2867 family)